MIRPPLLILLIIGLWISPGSHGHHERVCRESDPCWAWSKMGTYRRAVTLNSGGVLRVGPCKFRRLDIHDRIDWSTTDHEHGDRFAKKNGCKA